MTPDEYLAFERAAETKHEYLDGEVFDMSGGSARHSIIAGNLIGEIRAALKGRDCLTFTSDMRLKVQATGLYAYPAAQIACGPLEFEDDREDVILNPVVIIEVLSTSTASWDRGKKFWHYRHLDSLTDYVLVAQDEWLVEHYRRQPNGGWLLETLEQGTGRLRLESVGCEVPLTEVFSGTGLKPLGQS